MKHESTAEATPTPSPSIIVLGLLGLLAAPTLGGGAVGLFLGLLDVLPLWPALLVFSGAGLGLGAIGAASWSIATLRAASQTPTTINVLGPKPEEIRIVPYLGSRRLIDGVPEEDLIWFVEGLAAHGHTQRAWLRKVAPSGMIVDAEYWGKLCRPLRKVGIIQGAGPRKSGVLNTTHSPTILSYLQIKTR